MKMVWRIVLVGAAVAVTGLVLPGVCSRAYPKPNTRVVDSLKAVNAALAAREQILQAQNAELAIDRERIQRQRDSIKVVSDSVTKALRQRRAALVEAPPDSTLRSSYLEALGQLDEAFTELARKDDIIRRDSLEAKKSAEMEVNLRQQIADLKEAQANEAKQTAFWHEEYDKLYAEKHPRCGTKCGIIIGVVSTIAGAMALNALLP